MIQRTGCAFSPGHISAFFEPYPDGSRGAGLCISKGVLTKVTISTANAQKIEVYLDGQRTENTTNELVVRKLIGTKKLHVVVESKLQLPVAQGFGMSAAGALSTAIAVANALELNQSYLKTAKSAFEADLQLKTGLGDVVAEAFGGLVLRLVEGLPPKGIVKKLPVKNLNIVLCVVGKPFFTRAILTDERYKAKLTKIGRECLANFLKDTSIQNLFQTGLWFAEQTGLLERVDKNVKEAIDAVGKNGYASLAMLGNAVYAIGDTDEIVQILKKFGPTYVCTIDKKGARKLKPCGDVRK